MKTINRYILKEILPNFIVILIFFTSIILFYRLFRILQIMVSKGITLKIIFFALLANILPLLNYTLPAALLISIIIGMSRLNADNEILIIRSMGVSLFNIIKLPILLSLFLSIIIFILSSAFFPYLLKIQHYYYFQIKNLNPYNLIVEKEFIQFPEFSIYAEKKNESDKSIKNIVLIQQKEEEHTIFASKAYFKNINNVYYLFLLDGTIHRYIKKTQNYYISPFKEFKLRLWETSADLKDKYLIKEHSSIQLIKKIKSNIDENMKRLCLIEIYERIYLSFAAFALICFATPIILLSSSKRKSSGFAISIFLIFLYYFLYVIFYNLSKEIIHPAIALAIPDILFCVLGFGLIYYLTKK